MAIFRRDEHPGPGDLYIAISVVIPRVFHTQSARMGPDRYEISVYAKPESGSNFECCGVCDLGGSSYLRRLALMGRIFDLPGVRTLRASQEEVGRVGVHLWDVFPAHSRGEEGLAGGRGQWVVHLSSLLLCLIDMSRHKLYA